MTWATKLVALVALLFGIARGLVSCIIADPPPEPPELPTEAPSICVGTQPPSPGVALTQWPLDFVVPVLSSTPFVYAVYVDYSYPKNTTPLTAGTGFGNPDGGCQLVEMHGLTAPPGGACHVVSFYAAANPLNSGVEQFSVPGIVLGADTQAVVTWYYQENGQGACSSFDAGAYSDGAFPPMMDGIAPPTGDK
jgi:hypothetical protein